MNNQSTQLSMPNSLQWFYSSQIQKPHLEFQLPGLLDVMTTSVSGNSHLSPDTNFLQCKQVQLSVAAKLCFSVCLCLDMDWKFFRRLIPQLTQTQSGLATVGVGSASRGTRELVNGNINRVPSCSPAPASHLLFTRGIFHPEASERSDSVIYSTLPIIAANGQVPHFSADKGTVFFKLKVTNYSLRRLVTSQMVIFYNQVQKQSN